jgi:hypothetical protein
MPRALVWRASCFCPACLRTVPALLMSITSSPTSLPRNYCTGNCVCICRSSTLFNGFVCLPVYSALRIPIDGLAKFITKQYHRVGLPTPDLFSTSFRRHGRHMVLPVKTDGLSPLQYPIVASIHKPTFSLSLY